MADRLLTSRDIQSLVGAGSPKAAERLMDEWEVPFVHLGLGRGKGRRWKESKVMAAIDARECILGDSKKTKKIQEDDDDYFWSLSAKEAYALTHGKKK